MANSCGSRSFQIRHRIAELLRLYAIRVPLLLRSLVYTDHFPRAGLLTGGGVYCDAFSSQMNSASANPGFAGFIKVLSGSHVQLFSQLHGFPG